LWLPVVDSRRRPDFNEQISNLICRGRKRMPTIDSPVLDGPLLLRPLKLALAMCYWKEVPTLHSSLRRVRAALKARVGGRGRLRICFRADRALTSRMVVFAGREGSARASPVAGHRHKRCFSEQIRSPTDL